MTKGTRVMDTKVMMFVEEAALTVGAPTVPLVSAELQ